MKSKERLAKLLHISRRKLEALTDSEDLYIERDRFNPKKGKPFRVEEPRLPLKRVQKRIEELLKRVKMPNYIHAPAKGRSYISNAKAHINVAVVRSLDIKQYFPSSQSWRVYSFFYKQMRCSSDVAGILTRLSTFKRHLPTGSPSSPVISYFAHIDMWEAINELVEGEGCTLTVYMDDVTISGSSVPDKLIWQVKKEFYCCGLRDSRIKEKHYVGNKPREITGVIVKDGELKVPNSQHKKMHDCRQAIQRENDPTKLAHLMQSLKGLKSQAQQIRKANEIHVDNGCNVYD
ncbi:reverse transcriptase family protein [Nostoc sp.]|uniref:reverse transcriptase family protein n=1 Tax=Nostoc sp. TaxID=1180 RepID=UPI002FF78B82